MYCLHEYLGFLDAERVGEQRTTVPQAIFSRRKAFEGTTIQQLQVRSSMYLAWPSIDTWLGGLREGLDVLP